MAVLNGSRTITKHLLDSKAESNTTINTLLIWTAKCNHPDIVELLLDRKADIHVEDDFVLNRAARNGYLDLVELLLDRNANIHAENGRPLIISMLLNFFSSEKRISMQETMVHSS